MVSEATGTPGFPGRSDARANDLCSVLDNEFVMYACIYICIN